jgi:uncharacterized hydantoinase/oxoprolinase family protein
LVLGDLPEDPADTQTADGRGATRAAARARLARCLCSDSDTFDDQDATSMARSIADSQRNQVAASIRRVIRTMPQTPETVVISGQGEFLARRAAAHACTPRQLTSLAQLLGAAVSQCAPAHAVATLALEENPSP